MDVLSFKKSLFVERRMMIFFMNDDDGKYAYGGNMNMMKKSGMCEREKTFPCLNKIDIFWYLIYIYIVFDFRSH